MSSAPTWIKQPSASNTIQHLPKDKYWKSQGYIYHDGPVCLTHIFLYWVECPFQHISGHIRMVPALTESMITTLYTAVSLKYHIAGTFVWYPASHIILAKKKPVFALNFNPLFVKHLTRELKLSIQNLWFDSAGKQTWNLPDMEWMLTTRLSVLTGSVSHTAIP